LTNYKNLNYQKLRLTKFCVLEVESTCLEVDDEFDEDSCNSSEYSDEEMNEDSDVSDDEYLDYSEELESGDECLPNAVWVKLSKL